MPGKNRAREPLSGMDAAMIDLETPTNLMVINAVMILAAPLTLDDLKAVIRGRLTPIRRFRQRVVRDPGRRPTLYWEDDPAFDVDNHVHRIALPGSSLPAETGKQTPSAMHRAEHGAPHLALQDLVGELASVPLELSRPLWAFYLIDGYGEGAALVCRVHHSIADGIALIGVLLSITDPEPLAAPMSPAANSEPPYLREDRVSGTPRRRPVRRLLRMGLSVAAHPSRLVRIVGSGWRAASTMGDLVLDPPDSPTAFKGRVGLAKQVAWSGPIPLQQVKAIGRAMGGTVNDILLAAVSGALRRYLEGRGECAEGIALHAAVPVNLRGNGAHTDTSAGSTSEPAFALGNRIGTVFVPLPVAVVDPVRRLWAVKRAMDRLKASYQAPATFAAMQALTLASSSVKRSFVTLLGGRATAIMTNVVGPKEPSYLAGAPIEALFFWVPKTGGLALGVSILSYAGQVRLGIITDAGLLPDPETIISAFEAEFDDLLAAAQGIEEMPTVGQMSAMLDDALATLDALLESRSTMPALVSTDDLRPLPATLVE
jgi:diacylglycerol O-acyltransferase / wax synthase